MDRPDLENFHQEALEVIGHLVRDFKAINGDEDPDILKEMLISVDNGRTCFLKACGFLDDLIAKKREAE